ncbi:DNA cytosine methyltransferase [Nostoc edaphicum CCNP1411]|uniref:Cytosine-specific methyltransferase n=1 Tax=Nostoc edaphicum CCNP1411 TaxID=1472755 RepID=A0A7D7QED6_9NOSO|nr:DNA cytosine methyltransferase [Nostoc edaphicum]QMS86662.1 DNA cytosine methyltransferase [Nostoc edaphicum CCNP1411]
MNYEPIVLEKKINSLKIREMTAIENKLNAGTKELMALSLFSGGGGLDLGFSAAGFRVGCSTDIDSFSCQTLILNNGRKIFYNHAYSITADIREISAEYLLRKAELSDSKIDIVLGGPPCQAFSIFGRRKGLDDPRGNLVWEYLKIIQEIKPKAFVFENVPGLKSIHNGKLFEEILSELTIGGTYAISTHSYQMAEYGIPQFRERVFVIGSQNGSIVPRMLPTHGRESLLAPKNYRTVREALRYLPEPGTFSTVLNHIGRKHSPRIVSRYENLKFGERDPKTRINKLHPERPSFTIIVGSDKGGGKGHIHPFVPREVTPRESARMQTFPDWWEFYGTGRHVIRQVGNAVPPLFATLLAEHLRVHIFEGQKQRSYEDFIEILGLDYLQE